MRIETKAQFRDLWLRGVFGNKPRVWKSYEELQAAGYTGNVSFRMHVPDSRHTRYGVPADGIQAALGELQTVGIHASDIWFNESAPDDHLLLQGEYTDIERPGYVVDRYLMYSRAKTQMKKALALPLAIDLYIPGHLNWSHEAHCQFRHESEGLRTDLLLQSVMNANSWDDFCELRLLYPQHVIEFSVYDHCVGDCPHRNTLIWEVRDY